MKFVGRRLGLLAAVMAAVLFGSGTPASAADPANVGWLYTLTYSGAVFFDADLAGYPSYEKITVCDNVTDGRGIRAYVEGQGSGKVVIYPFSGKSEEL